MFGDSLRSVVQTKKILAFVLQCLTEMVPFEPPYCLRVRVSTGNYRVDRLMEERKGWG